LPPNDSFEIPTFSSGASEPDFDDLVDDSIGMMLRSASKAVMINDHTATLEAEAEEEEERAYQEVYQAVVIASMQSPSPFSGSEDTPFVLVQLLPIAEQDNFWNMSPAIPARILAPTPLLSLLQPTTAVTKITVTSECLTITTQLNATWMRDYEDHTKSVPLKKGVPRIEPTISQRFNIVYWDEHKSPGMVHGVSDCPQWPLFYLSNSPTVLTALRDNLKALDYHLSLSLSLL